jgi:hypothetical protein
LRRFVAEEPPPGGPDENRGPGKERFPGLSQGGQFFGRDRAAKVIKLFHQGEEPGLADRQHVREPGACRGCACG